MKLLTHGIAVSTVLLAFAGYSVADDDAPPIDAKTQATLRQLAMEQDELQADLSDIISDQTNAEVIELLKLCRTAMNDSIDLLEQHDSGSKTLAAQSDVIERIYQAMKEKYESSEDPEAAAGVMSMLQRMLSIPEGGEGGQSPNKPSQDVNDGGQGDGSPGNSENKHAGSQPGDSQSGGVAATQSAGKQGQSDPNIKTEERTVPKSSGVGPAEMPEEFRNMLELYNKTLQQ